MSRQRQYNNIRVSTTKKKPSTTIYVFVPHKKKPKPIGALELHGGQIHIYLHLYLYIYIYIYVYGPGGGSLEGAKTKNL